MMTPESLLAQMTWAEKISQLQIVWKRSAEEAADLARLGCGALFWPGTAAATNILQRVAVQESRLGIPLLIGLDVVHGQFTIFPTPLASAASFDPAVAVIDAEISAAEARSSGVNWTFSPMIDISRDPRWGRVVEGFGEDPYLTSVLGVAKTRGYQGRSLSDPSSMVACLKHYVGYGMAEGGRDYNTADASMTRLRNVYLEPFRQAVAAGAGSVMASFNTMNGVPMHANHALLTSVLKDEWGHPGVVVGDADGVAQLVDHGVARDGADAVRLALTAGLDVEMGGTVLDAAGTPVVGPDDLDPARVDDAVLRVLWLKQALGLFENPYVDEATEATEPTEATRAAARWAAERSIVLLKNEDGLLPLVGSGPRILLTGPYADSDDHLGAWVQHFAAKAGTLDAALRAERPDAVITVTDDLARAGDHDLIVLAVGEPSDFSGEASSRSDIRLPADQEALIHAVADTGVPFVVVLWTGRPLDLSPWIDRVPSLLLVWHLGTEAPAAIARTLSGAVNPAGRLPMSFPRTVGQIPIYHDHESTGRPAKTGGSYDFAHADVGLLGPGNTADFFTSKYLDLDLGPLFDFGSGLSYTTFAMDRPVTSRPEIGLADLRAGATIMVSLGVRNTGDRAGDDVVQLYVRDHLASIAPAVRRLRGFQRIHVEPGETGPVTFTLAYDDLGFWTNDPAGAFVVEPGAFTITVTDGSVTHHLEVVVS